MSAQILDAEGQYVDTVFHDNVDRTAEDFVVASILTLDPIGGVLSPAGHAAIRLQCPVFDLDYVYHYAMVNTKEGISEQRAFLTGKFYVRMFADTFSTYLKNNQEVGRGIVESPLNLTSKEEQQLWQLLDEAIENNEKLKYDFVGDGCCSRIKKMVLKVLGAKKIDYSDYDLRHAESLNKLVAEAISPFPWLRFMMLTAICGNTSDMLLEEKLLFPKDLVHVWQKAKVDDKPLLGEAIRLLPNNEYKSNILIAPLHVAILLLLLSLITLFVQHSYFDWMIMSVQVLMACVVLVFSVLTISFLNWNWLLIPFNLFPILFWKWRRYWALPYVGVLLLWCIAMLLSPHMLVEMTHILFVIAFALVLLKQSNAKQFVLFKLSAFIKK